MRKMLYCLAVAAGLVAAPGSARANLIVNGGFETGDFTGWTTGGNFEFTGVTTFPVNSGNYSAFLGPVGSDGTLSQTFSTTPGGQYLVSFALNSDGGTPNDFSALFNGTPIFSQTDIPAQGFTTYTFSVTATGSTSSLLFAFRNDPSYLYLDDVSVDPVPEPATLAVFGLLGVGGLGYVRRRLKAVPVV